MAQEAEGYGGYGGYQGYGAPMDPQTMRAKLAMAMLQQGSDSSPIRSPWQGAARMSNALFGALMMRQMQDKQTGNNQAIMDQFNAARASGFGMGGAGAVPGGGSPGLPPQPGALSDLTNDPDMQRGVANAATNGLPDSATIGASMQRGPSPPQMGPPMPGMAPNNSAGGTMIPGYMGGAGAPGGNNAGGPPPANMTAQAGRPPLDPRMMVAGPGAPSLPPSGPAPGNGPQGAGAGSFNPQDLAMFQQDMQGVPGTPAGGGGGPPGGGGQMGQYIAQKAASMGIDPNVALKVAGSEGLNNYTGDGGSSFGPFQLHYGGINPNMPHPGLGDAFTQATGLHASDPSTWKQQVDFALSQAKQGGWGPWMGAKASGITGFAGIGQAPSGAAGGTPSAMAFNGGQTPPPSGPALAAIQGAAGPPGGGPAPNNMFAQDMQGVPGGPSGPQGQVPASMQPNMMVAGPGVPSGARGGNPNMPPPMPPPGAMGPPPGGGGGNPLSALGNMFGIGNPSGPQGGSSPAPAGGGAAGGQGGLPGVDPQVLMRVAMDPYSSPQARQMAGQLLQYYMPHPTTWEAMPGTNNLAEKNWMGQFTGRTQAGPHQTSVVDAGTDFMGVKHQGVFDKDAPLGQQVTVIDPATGRPTSVSPGQAGGGGVPPSPTGSSVTPAAPGAKVWSPGQPLDPAIDSKIQGLAVQFAGSDPRGQAEVYQYAKALLQGNQQFVTAQNVAKSPPVQAAETIARMVDPDGLPQTRFDTIKSNADMSAPTALGGQRMAAQTSVRHIGSLASASDLLANQGQVSSSEMGAELQNWAQRNLGGASSKFTTASQAYNAALVPVLGEIDKLYKGGQATEGEIMEMKSNLAPTASPDARRAALTMLSGLLQDKVQVLQDNWHNGVGKNFPDLPIIDQRGQEGLDYIKNWKADGGQGQSAPAGQWHAGGTPTGPIIPAPGGAQAAPAQSQQGDPLSQARAAIAKGAPRAAVIQRLQAMGVNPAGL